jgi:hypothetical protein
MIKNDQLKCSLKKEKIGLDMGSTLRGAQPTGAYSRAGCKSQGFSKTKHFKKAASPPGRLQRFVCAGHGT